MSVRWAQASGPTRASRLDPSLDCSLWAPTTDLTYKCHSIFQWLTAGFLYFLLTESHVLSLGLKMHWSKSVKSCECDQRSWPSFHPWSRSNCPISGITSLSLGQRNVFNTIRAPELTMQTLVQWEHFAGPSWKYEGPRLFPLFWRLPRCKALGSISSIHTLIWKASFCQPFRQGSKLVNWEKSTLGWAQRLWNGVKNVGKVRNFT